MTAESPKDKPPSNASKSRARLVAVQAIYQMTATSVSANAIIGEFIRIRLPSDRKPFLSKATLEPEETAMLEHDVDVELFSSIIRTLDARKDDIEQLLKSALEPQWTIARLEWPLQAVLRAGCAELIAGSSVDAAIIVNDYVNVAHAFFSGKEPGLVNGVLDKIAKNLRQ